jgi:hypothetical protein
VLSKAKDKYPDFKYYRYFRFPITIISAKIHVDLETDFQVRLLKFCYQIKNWQGGSELLLIVMCIRSQYSYIIYKATVRIFQTQVDLTDSGFLLVKPP